MRVGEEEALARLVDAARGASRQMLMPAAVGVVERPKAFHLAFAALVEALELWDEVRPSAKPAPQKFQHRDAYMLMRYRCGECGVEEVIWNGRDGLAPTLITCKACGACGPKGMCRTARCGTEPPSDEFSPSYVPSPGQRYFADMTAERARELADREAAFQVAAGRCPESEQKRRANGLFVTYFGDGRRPQIREAV